MSPKAREESFPGSVSPWVYPAVTVIFLLVFAMTNLVYLNQDYVTTLLSDSPRHLRRALDNYQLAHSGKFLSMIFAPVTYFYPPLVYFLTVPIFWMMGPRVGAAILGQGIFWILLGYSVYQAGREAAGKQGGFLAVLLTLSVPYLAKCSRDYCLDVPLTAMTALCLWTLMKSRFFSVSRNTVIFFVCAALGFLTKTMAPLYLALPVLIAFIVFIYRAGPKWYLRLAGVLPIPLVSLVMGVILAYGIMPAIRFPHGFYYGYKNVVVFAISVLPVLVGLAVVLRQKTTDKAARGMALGINTFMLICWPYYGIFMKEVLQRSRHLGGGGIDTRGFADFIRVLTFQSWGIPLVSFTIVGVLVVLLSKYGSLRTNKDSKLIIPLAMLIGGLFLLYFFPIKDDRYFLPLIPAASVIAVAGVLSIRSKLVRWPAVAVLSYLCLVGMLGWAFEGTGFLEPVKWSRTRPLYGGYYGMIPPPPACGGPYIPGLCDSIAIMSGGRPFVLVVAAEEPIWGARGANGIITYYRYRHAMQLYTLHKLGNITFSHLDVGLPPEEVQKAYCYLGMSPDRSKVRLEDYSRLVALFFNSSPNLETIPWRLREDMSREGMSTRPQAYVGFTSVPLDEKSSLMVHLSLFSVKRKKSTSFIR